MKWFKHMTSSHDDEGLSRVIDELGLRGYGEWWLLLEIIASQMDKTDRCSVVYSQKKWVRIFGTYPKKLQKTLTTFAKHLNICWISFGKDIEISIPNLLKYRDNYTKDLVVTTKRLPSIEVEVEVERDSLESSLRSDSCSEPEKPVSKPAEKPIKISFDFQTGKFGHLEPGLIEIWNVAFPAVNLDQEITRAGAWLIANPKNRKSDYRRFLNNWLSRSQDRAARAAPGATSSGGETVDEWIKRRAEEKCNEEERKREQREAERKDIENKGMF